MLEFGIQASHFAINFDTGDAFADLGMKAVGEIERKRAFGKVNNVTFGGVDKNFVGEKIKTKFFNIDFFAGAKFRGGFLEFSNPEEVGWEMLNFAGFVIFGKFLLVIVEASGKTMFGVFVHFVSTNLKFNDAFVLGDNSGMKRLITVLLWHGDIIFDAAGHWHIEGMNNAECEIAVGDVIYDNTESSKIVNFAHVLIVLGKFFVK